MPVNIRRALLVIVLLAASGSWQLSSNAQGVTEAERLLQKAILLETVDGNLQAAIDQYQENRCGERRQPRGHRPSAPALGRVLREARRHPGATGPHGVRAGCPRVR